MVDDQNIIDGEEAERSRQLWHAVILMALEDACGVSTWVNPSEKRNGIIAAKAWFRDNTPDFIEACYLAELDPTAVRARALRMIGEAEEAQRKNEKYSFTKAQVSSAKMGRPAARYTHDGQTLTIKEWSERTGKSAALIGDRLRRGWSIADAVTMSSADAFSRSCSNPAWRPGPTAKTYTVDGQTMSLDAWAESINVTRSALVNRMRRGLTLAEALNMKLHSKIEDAIAQPSEDRVAATDKGRGRVEAPVPDEKTGGESSTQETLELEVFA